MNIQPAINPIIQCFNEKLNQTRLLYRVNHTPQLVFSNDEPTNDLGACVSTPKGIFVYINPKAIKRSPEALEEIVAHEMAHFVCFDKGMSAEGHGAFWQEVCQRLGGSAQEKSFDKAFEGIFTPSLHYKWESLGCFEILDEKEHEFIVSLAQNRPKWLRGYTGEKFIL